MRRSQAVTLLAAYLAFCSCGPNVIRGEIDATTPVDRASSSSGASLPAEQSQTTAPVWKRIQGTPGKDSRYGAGYIDLRPTITFGQGEKLRLRIGETAKRVVVRLLPSGADPAEAVGVLGTFDVPTDRLLVLTLDA